MEATGARGRRARDPLHVSTVAERRSLHRAFTTSRSPACCPRCRSDWHDRRGMHSEAWTDDGRLFPHCCVVAALARCSRPAAAERRRATGTAATTEAAARRQRRRALRAASRPTARAPSARSRRAAAERFQQENPDVQITVGVSGTGGGFERFCAGETDISNASRPIEDDEEAAPARRSGVEYVEFQVANDALTVVVNTENDWATCLTVDQLNDDLGARLDKVDELEPGRPELPGRGAHPLRAGHRLGHVRLLHRRHQRRGGREPRRLLRERGRQRHRPGRRAARRAAWATSASPTSSRTRTAEGGRDRRRRRLRRAEPRDGAGRHLQAALAAALRLREEGVAREAGGCRRSSSTCSTTPPRSPRQALFVPLTDEQRGRRRKSTPRSRQASRGRRGDAATSRARRAAGQPAARPTRRRWGEDAVKVVLGLCALVSVATTVGIVIALLEPAIEFFREIELRSTSSPGRAGRRCSSPPTSASCPLARRHVLGHDLGRARLHPVRARRGDLPERVRAPAGAEVPQAGCSRSSPGSRPSSSATSRCSFVTPLLQDIGIEVGDVQRALRRARRRRHAHPHGRLALRGRDDRGAAGSPGRRLRARRVAAQGRDAVVVPAAISGIIASFVLAISRAVGETMIVLHRRRPAAATDARSARGRARR